MSTPPLTSPLDSATAAAPAANVQDAVIRLAGNSQDGIQSIGGFLARLAGRTQQDVMTYMTIPSTISGGPSIFQVHIGSGEILSAGDEADFLVCFYQHSYQDHIGALREGRIAGAGLDVFDIEPLPPGHPILAAPNTVLTPHLGYVSEENYRVYYQGAVEAILGYQEGKPVREMKAG